eukprot:TRINITY_DN4738_c0_g2_i1.p1 TRINITY_DN4738_c0_g2~~TRINITY_DN4738_c0_g2_i1.p1  ORF type:complete len:961 (+),score=262.30 TRINITY_DN4738_c0_g2_i1:61-2943(+)
MVPPLRDPAAVGTESGRRGLRYARRWLRGSGAEELIAELFTALAAARPSDPWSFVGRYCAGCAPVRQPDPERRPPRCAEVAHAAAAPALRYSRPYLDSDAVRGLADELLAALAAARPSDVRRFVRDYCVRHAPHLAAEIERDTRAPEARPPPPEPSSPPSPEARPVQVRPPQQQPAKQHCPPTRQGGLPSAPKRQLRVEVVAASCKSGQTPTASPARTAASTDAEHRAERRDQTPTGSPARTAASGQTPGVSPAGAGAGKSGLLSPCPPAGCQPLADGSGDGTSRRGSVAVPIPDEHSWCAVPSSLVPGGTVHAPAEIVVQLGAVAHSDIEDVLQAWMDRAARVSAEQDITLVALPHHTTAVHDQVRAIRRALGIPQNNKTYRMRFVYPAAGCDAPQSHSDLARRGGYVYYSGQWRGLSPEATEIVGANLLYYVFLVDKGQPCAAAWDDNNMYSMRLQKIGTRPEDCHHDDPRKALEELVEETEKKESSPGAGHGWFGSVKKKRTFIDVVQHTLAMRRRGNHGGEGGEVGGWASLPEEMDILKDVFGAGEHGKLQFAWVPPEKSWIIVPPGDDLATINDALIASADGSFVFRRTVRGPDGSEHDDVWMYSMVVRRLKERCPYATAGAPLEAITDDRAKALARKYISRQSAVAVTPAPSPRKNPAGWQGGKRCAAPRHLLILLGGSGAGKSTLLRRIADCWDQDPGRRGPFWGEWVLSGLDEFLQFVPQYQASISNPTVGFLTAADQSYPAAVKIAKAVNAAVLEEGYHLIVEDTGKDLARTCDFIRKYSVDEPRRVVTVALVDNSPTIAMRRALGRFQLEGRYSSGEYVRHSFGGVFENYCELRQQAGKEGSGVPKIDSFIYVNNEACSSQSSVDNRIWLDVAGDHPILPKEKFLFAPVYRQHAFMMRRWLSEAAADEEAAGSGFADLFQDWMWRKLNPELADTPTSEIRRLRDRGSPCA